MPIYCKVTIRRSSPNFSSKISIPKEKQLADEVTHLL